MDNLIASFVVKRCDFTSAQHRKSIGYSVRSDRRQIDDSRCADDADADADDYDDCGRRGTADEHAATWCGIY